MNTPNSHDIDPENQEQIIWIPTDRQLYWHSGKLSSTLGNYITYNYIYMIEVLHKIWILQQENKYSVLDYSGNIDYRKFDYKVYRKSILKPNPYWESRKRWYLILFYDKLHPKEIMKYLRVVYKVDQPMKDKIISIIKDFWYCFLQIRSTMHYHWIRICNIYRKHKAFML